MLHVHLSHLADRKLTLLLDYIESEWSKNVRDRFLEDMLDSFNRIAHHPESCPKSSEFPNLYKCVVSEQTSYFYRINISDIEIITVFDNRQDPISIATILEEQADEHPLEKAYTEISQKHRASLDKLAD